jgi:hypothetical protein
MVVFLILSFLDILDFLRASISVAIIHAHTKLHVLNHEQPILNILISMDRDITTLTGC